MEGTATDKAEPGLSGEDKVCAEKSKENVEPGTKYPKEGTGAGNVEKEVMEITTENGENVKQGSKCLQKRIGIGDAENAMEIKRESKESVEQASIQSEKMKAKKWARRSAVQTKNNYMSDIQGETHQTMPASIPEATTAKKDQQMDTSTLTPNEDLLLTSSAATVTVNTNVFKPTSTHKQFRGKKHDTANNSAKSTATRVSRGAQAGTQTHLRETDTAVTTSRRRKTVTSTADVHAVRERGKEKATRKELKRKDDIEVSPV